MKRFIILTALAIVLSSTSAYAAVSQERVVSVDMIRAMEGVVHVLMPCNWLRDLNAHPVAVKAIYKDGEEVTEVDIDASTEASGRYLIVTVPQGVISETLDYARVIYSVNEGQHCDSGYGGGFISK